MKHLGPGFLYVFLLLGIISCKKEEDPLPQMILGRWEIREAFRNGRTTESLADLFFDFRTEGKMSTNLPVTEVPMQATYEIRKGKIQQKQGELSMEYQIEEITDTSLILNTTFRDYAFRFVLAKYRPGQEAM